MQLNLVPHPTTPPADPAFKLWVNIDHPGSLGSVATINLWFGLSAPASRFVIPEPKEGARAEGLWENTCFEMFLRRNGEDSYREWNFAPSGDWAAYDFDDYREGKVEAPVSSPPYIRMEDNFTWWAVGATIAIKASDDWRVGLSAVLEETDGTKSYWALAHPTADKPDFHHPDCFAATLP